MTGAPPPPPSAWKADQTSPRAYSKSEARRPEALDSEPELHVLTQIAARGGVPCKQKLCGLGAACQDMWWFQ